VFQIRSSCRRVCRFYRFWPFVESATSVFSMTGRGSIPPAGTTRSRHHFIPEEIYFSMSEINEFSVLNSGLQCECPEVFCQYCARHFNTVGMRD
jgi:hypothetical protein